MPEFKIIHFILPDRGAEASIYVRAKSLKDFRSNGTRFEFLSTTFPLINSRVRRKLFWAIYNFKLIKKRIPSRFEALYFIKPSSFFLLFFCRIYGYKVYIDINDPLHRREHLGCFGIIKFILFCLVANGLIFESYEYYQYWKWMFFKKSTIIEDTPQIHKIYEKYKTREHNLIIWFGSKETSIVLMQYIDYFKAASEKSYKFLLMGADSAIVSKITEAGCLCESVDKYDHSVLVENLERAQFAFIPMPNKPSYTLRGNLKAKMAMAFGCIVLASDIPMHNRLIKNTYDGFLFKDLTSFSNYLESIRKMNVSEVINISKAANHKIMSNFNPENQAKQICEFVK
jgi:glycosyltransferase involved in cell wall biosynthesis